jgi:phage terminase Nu1 subunit (DNA packaging protein)
MTERHGDLEAVDELRGEVWVDVRELARIMGVSVSTVKRWKAAGMPSEDWGMKRTRRYLPSKCMAWARNRPYDEREPGSRPQRGPDHQPKE